MHIASLFMVFFLLGWFSTVSAAEVKTQKTANGWEFLVDGKPFFIKGMCYSPTAIGESSDDNTRRNWIIVDDDHDGRNDYAYQTWVDANRNNRRDTDEKEVGDFELMRQMGVNCIRIYHHLTLDPELQKLNAHSNAVLNFQPDFPPSKEKEILRQLHSKYGIWVAMGDCLGSYIVGSGASWDKGTDYTDPVQQKNMLKSVEEMVRMHKDEPYLLMWILGNENNLEGFTHTNASRQPEAYARLVNEAAILIKKIDGRHPVAICNGACGLIEYYAKYAPAVDIFGSNDYTNDMFIGLWDKVDAVYDRPVMLTEFGPSTTVIIKDELSEDSQALSHRVIWRDIIRHRAGKEKPGNAIGGFIFEWVDQWWPDGNKYQHNRGKDIHGYNQEYYGITSLGDGSAGPLVRQLRKVYWIYQELWKKDSP